MKQITLFACDAALCAAEKPDKSRCQSGVGPWFRRKRGAGLCRAARHDSTSLRGRVGLDGFLHRRFDLDVRPLNLWKNSRSRFFKQPLVVLID